MLAQMISVRAFIKQIRLQVKRLPLCLMVRGLCDVVSFNQVCIKQFMLLRNTLAINRPFRNLITRTRRADHGY